MVSPEKVKALDLALKALGLKPEDISEQFSRSAGKGGQYVNKNSTAVQLLYIPDQKIFSSQESRSQYLNRYYAKKKLLGYLQSKVLGSAAPEAKKIAKIQKQKARRKRRAKRLEE